jgi:hypothetical protein
MSGEESDDEDLTDTESSISGWSSTRCKLLPDANHYNC